jgi:hypothetical protein
MPLHDWTRVPAGLFHDFYQSWSIRITEALNAGRLPTGTAALVEQRDESTTQITRRSAKSLYASRANRIVIKQHLKRTLAVIEIVSPGNKDSRAALRDFVEKSIEFLKTGIHVLVVDLFPPTPRDPCGIHKVIWDEFEEEPFTLPAGKDRILASYETGSERAAYIEPVGVGDKLAEMPLFLSNFLHVPVPLEPTYLATWEASPEDLRVAVETGVLPQVDEE